MTQFPGARQPALGIQDAAMLPAQTAGNLFVQRLAAAEAAFVPTTQTFDSTTSSTVLNSTSASTGGGSLRSLMIPVNTANFVPIVPNASPAFYRGPQFSQFGNQELTAAIIAGSQTCPGSMAGRAVLNACGIDYGGSCGCACVREMSEETVIDEDNTNGIDDGTVQPLPQPPVYSPPASVRVAQGCQAAQEAQAAAASIQYVTYNA